MQGHLLNAQVVGVGEYDFAGEHGEKYRYLDLYDESAATPADAIVRMSVGKDASVPDTVTMGSRVDVWFNIRPAQKSVRGESRDRVIGVLKLQAVDVQIATGANGRKSDTLAKAA
jgi:hypothetical protein